MNRKFDEQIAIQRQYYSDTAADYNNLHMDECGEHYFALTFLEAIIDFYGIESVLDIGAGTGRVALHLKEKKPGLKIVSVEPVSALRQIGHDAGLSEEELLDGDATALAFANNEFDLVCEFGVLHHIPTPERAVSEMLRVGKKGVFISDSNNFGQGSYLSRSLKQVLNALRLWPLANFIKTKGKGYTIFEGDGLAYSYSVYSDYDLIKKACSRVHVLNTKDGAINPYRTASHVALLGIK